jgi:N,N'-diacetyllegionaminate synthase
VSRAPKIRLGNRSISQDHSTYVIAEIGVNHDGSLDLAHKLIDLAHMSGADAVKFQTYVTDELVRVDARKAAYQLASSGEGTQADMLRKYELPFDAFVELKLHCDRIGIDFISTAFDAPSLEFVISLDPVCLKWASGELTNKPLLRLASQSGLPMLLSTGMGTMDEISEACDWLGAATPLVILQCVSNYPAAIEDQNLRTLPTMQAAFNCPVGFSDHTIGPYAAIAARSLGMAVLEKHFTIDSSLPGPDHAASVMPDDFWNLVTLLRKIELGLGDGIKRPQSIEADVRQVARKSLVYRRALPKGHQIKAEDITAKRPGTGLAPASFDRVIGQSLGLSVERDQLVQERDFG